MSSLLEQADNDFTRVAAKCAAETRLEPAIEIMAKLSELFKRPVILAGGAVRDAMLERSIKDYDLFVSELPEGMSPLDLCAALTVHSANVISIAPNYMGADTLIGREMKTITSWTDPTTNMPVQLIELRGEEHINLAKAVGRFDIGLCQAGLALNRCDTDPVYRGEFHFTDAFWGDVAERTMTYLKDGLDAAQVDRSRRRCVRLSEKYQSYRFVEPGDAFG